MLAYIRRFLREAARLIDKPEKWVVETEAVNGAGRPVQSVDPSAVAWDLLGALHKVFYEDAEKPEDMSFLDIIDFISPLIPSSEFDDTLVWGSYWRVSHYQDNAEHNQVIELLELAVRRSLTPIGRSMPAATAETYQGSIDLLERVLTRLSDPMKWNKQGWTRNSDGERKGIHDPGAKAWCLVAALAVEEGAGSITSKDAAEMLSGVTNGPPFRTPQGDVAYAALCQRLDRKKWKLLSDFNDSPETKHSDMLEQIEHAILYLERTKPS